MNFPLTRESDTYCNRTGNGFSTQLRAVIMVPITLNYNLQCFLTSARLCLQRERTDIMMVTWAWDAFVTRQIASAKAKMRLLNSSFVLNTYATQVTMKAREPIRISFLERLVPIFILKWDDFLWNLCWLWDFFSKLRVRHFHNSCA